MNNSVLSVILEGRLDTDAAPLLEEFLTEIDGMDMDMIPLNSLVREFVGGSHYDY